MCVVLWGLVDPLLQGVVRDRVRDQAAAGWPIQQVSRLVGYGSGA